MRAYLPILLVVSLFLGACSGPQSRPDLPRAYLDQAVDPKFGPDLAPGPDQTPLDVGFLAWFEGRTEEAEALGTLVGQQPSALALMGQAELARQRGDLSASLSAHLRLLNRFPDHPLARLSAWRVWQLRSFVAAFDELAEDTLTQPKLWKAIAPESAIPLARALAHIRLTRAQREPTAPLDLATLGRPHDWHWTGPFSFQDHIGFQKVHPPESDAVLAERYTVGEHILTRRTHRFESQVQPAWPAVGVYYLETFVEVTQPARFILALNTQSHTRVWINDEVLLHRDQEDGYPPAELARLVELSPGKHRIRVKFAAGSGRSNFDLQLIALGDPRPPLKTAAPTSSWAQATPGLWLKQQGGLPSDVHAMANNPFLLWLAATYAHAVGDFERGRLAAELAAPLLGNFVPMLEVDAWLLQADPGLDPSIGIGEAFTRLQRALEIDKRAGVIYLDLALIYSNQGMVEDALSSIEQLIAVAPDAFIAHYYRFVLLDQQGWTQLALGALKEAHKLDPRNCEISGHVVQLTPNAELSVIEESARSCPAVLEHEALDQIAAGAHEAALDIYQKLFERFPNRLDLIPVIARVLTTLDREPEALALLESFPEEASGRTEAVRSRVDLLFSQGDSSAAAAVLDEALGAEPANLRHIELKRLFGGERILADLRIDGLRVVQDYLADARNYTQSAYYLLDYAAFRYFPDGSSLSVTHQILQVRNKDGIDQFGEVRFPADAIITQLRTIKSDGITVIEPESIPHKNSISMPNLAPGDFIEMEYLQATTANARRDPSFIAPRWFFKIPEAPLMYSELIVELPEGLEPQIDLRGPVVAPEITTHDGFKRYRYLMTEMLPPRPEPNGPSQVELVPSVQFGYGYSIDDIRLLYANDLADLTRTTPYLEHAYEEAIEGAVSHDQIAYRIFRFLERSIVDDSQSIFDKPASWVWTSGKGSRLLLMKALLDIGGVPNEMVLVKPFSAPVADNAVPELRFYSQPVLRVDVGDDAPLWLDPSLTHARYNYVAPGLQGQPAVALATGERLTVGRFDPDMDRSTTHLELMFDETGAVSATGTDITDGVRGTNIRQYYERNAADWARIQRDLSAQLTRFFNDAQVVDFTFEGFSEEGPISVSYDFIATNVAQRSGDSLLFRAQFYPQELSARFASQQTREQTLVLAGPIRSQLTVNMTLPPGFSVSQAPQPLRLDTPFGVYSKEVEVQDQVIVIRERVDLPKQRISPEQYKAFRELAAQIDSAQLLVFEAVQDAR